VPEILFPTSTAPGVNPTESGGRLINAYAEKAPAGSRSEFIRRRAPGLTEAFELIPGHRGSLLVGNVLYGVADDTVYSITKSGDVYTVTALTGDDVGGVGKVMMARNQASTPQLLIWHSAGFSQVNTGAGTVADFSDADLPAANSICFVGGYFFFTIGDGRCFASGVNAVTVASTDWTRAEKSPDGLVRGVRYGSSLLLCGAKTLEAWDAAVGVASGFPFTFSTVIPIGLLSPFAIAGMEDGFETRIVLVASDRTVRLLNGYSPEKISTPDLDRLIEAVTDVDDLEMSVYVAAGHSCIVLSSTDWTWVYDLGTRTWHERQSYGQTRWRASMGVNAFDEWLTFDAETAQVFRVDATNQQEDQDPLIWEVRSTQAHRFPKRMKIKDVAFDFEPGVGIDAGTDQQADPQVSISWSDDGGRTFGQAVLRRLGSEGEIVTAKITNAGLCGTRGRQWRLQISDPVPVALHGGAFQVGRAG
jgi:hypothetical protein